MRVNAASSPRLIARIAGLLYLTIIFATPLAEVIVPSLVLVPGDAAASAAAILDRELLYRLGGAALLLTIPCDIALAVIFYELLKPLGSGLSLLAAFLRLATIIIVAVNAISYFVPLALLHGSAYNLSAEEVQSLAMLSLRVHAIGFNICLLVFSFDCLCLGALIMRATFLPRFIGVLLAAAGLSYLINGFAIFIAPDLAARFVPYILLPPLVGELGLALWLTIAGVNTERWRAAAGAPA